MDDDARRGAMEGAERELAGLEAERADLRARARGATEPGEAARLRRRAEGLGVRIAAAREWAAQLRSRLARQRLAARRGRPPGRDDAPRDGA